MNNTVKNVKEVLAITNEAVDKLNVTDRLIETLNELLGPMITKNEPGKKDMEEIQRKCRMIDGTLLQVEINVKETIEELETIGSIRA